MSITLGITASYWLEYGTHYIGGVRCTPDIAYTGGSDSRHTYDLRHDVGPHGCTGQSDALRRLPLALQTLPALALGLGMLAFPESPRFLMTKRRENLAMSALSKLRRVRSEERVLMAEFLAIKAEVLFQESFIADHYPGKSGFQLALAEYGALVSTKSAFRRLAVGCCVMFFQQFVSPIPPMVVCTFAMPSHNLRSCH